MKENTVLLSLSDYDELKRIEREHEEFCDNNIIELPRRKRKRFVSK